MAAARPLNILITGGARGIGRGLLRHFIRSGNSVLILDSNTDELENVKSIADMWPSNKSSAWHALQCDLSDREQIKKAAQDAKRIFDGKLDVLINNAIPTPHVWSEGRAMEDNSEDIMDEWDLKVAVGLTAPFMLSRLCVTMLRAADPPGSIINISSTRAYQAEPDHESYSAVKAGIIGLTQSMAVSLGHRHKIRVNAIIPGWINVENENKASDDAGRRWEEGLSSEDMEWHPAGRVGQVEDIGKAVEYLISADFVTGQEVVVDGGVTRKMVYPD